MPSNTLFNQQSTSSQINLLNSALRNQESHLITLNPGEQTNAHSNTNQQDNTISHFAEPRMEQVNFESRDFGKSNNGGGSTYHNANTILSNIIHQNSKNNNSHSNSQILIDSKGNLHNNDVKLEIQVDDEEIKIQDDSLPHTRTNTHTQIIKNSQNYKVIIHDNNQNKSNSGKNSNILTEQQDKSQDNNSDKNIFHEFNIISAHQQQQQSPIVKQPNIPYESANHSPNQNQKKYLNPKKLNKLNTMKQQQSPQNQNEIDYSPKNLQQNSNRKKKNIAIHQSHDVGKQILAFDIMSLDTVQSVIIEKVSKNQDHREIIEQVEQLFHKQYQPLQIIIDIYANQLISCKNDARLLKGQVQVFLNEVTNILPLRFIANENLEDDGISFYDQIQRMQTNSQNNSLNNDLGTKKINTYVGYVLEKWIAQGLFLTFENLTKAYKISVISDPQIHFQLRDKKVDHQEQIRQEELDALEDFLLNDQSNEQDFNQKISQIQDKISTFDMKLSTLETNDYNDHIKEKVQQLKSLIADRIKQNMASNLKKSFLPISKLQTQPLTVSSQANSAQQPLMQQITQFVPNIKLNQSQNPSSNFLVQDQSYINTATVSNASIASPELKPSLAQKERNRQKSIKIIFDYYASQTNIGNKKKQNFDQFKQDHNIVNLGQVMKFIMDFKLPIKKDKVLELFRKSSQTKTGSDLTLQDFSQFIESMQKLFENTYVSPQSLKNIKSDGISCKFSSQIALKNKIDINNQYQNDDNSYGINCCSSKQTFNLEQPEEIRKYLQHMKINELNKHDSNSIMSEDRSISLNAKMNNLPVLNSKIINNSLIQISRKKKNVGSIDSQQKLPSIHSKNDQNQVITLLNQNSSMKSSLNNSIMDLKQYSNTELQISPKLQHRGAGSNSKDRSQYLTYQDLSNINYEELNRQETDDFVPQNFGFEQNPPREELSVTRQYTNKVLQDLENKTLPHQPVKQDSHLLLPIPQHQQKQKITSSQSNLLNVKVSSKFSSKTNTPKHNKSPVSSTNKLQKETSSYSNNAAQINCNVQKTFSFLDNNPEAVDQVIKVNDILRQRESKSIKPSPYEQSTQNLIIRNLRIRKPRYNNKTIASVDQKEKPYVSKARMLKETLTHLNNSHNYTDQLQSQSNSPDRSISRDSKNPFKSQLKFIESPKGILKQAQINGIKQQQSQQLKNNYMSRLREYNQKSNLNQSSQVNSNNQSQQIQNITKDKQNATQNLQSLNSSMEYQSNKSLSNIQPRQFQNRRDQSFSALYTPSQLLNTTAASILLGSQTIDKLRKNSEKIQNNKSYNLQNYNNQNNTQQQQFQQNVRQLYGQQPSQQDTSQLIKRYQNKLQNAVDLSRGRQNSFQQQQQYNIVSGAYIINQNSPIAGHNKKINTNRQNYSSLSIYDKSKKSAIV